MQIQHHYRGNNLFETVVIISIIIVLAVIAIPSVSDLLLRKDMENAQDTVVETLRLAKQTARSQNTKIKVHISNKSIVIRSINDTEIKNVSLPKQVNIDYAHNLVFLPDGRVVSQKSGILVDLADHIITIKSSSYNQILVEQVSIDALGRIASM